MSAFPKFMRSGRGQSTVELAFAFPLLMLVFFAVVEFSHLFYVRVTLQHALRQAGRYAVTGQGQDPIDADARIEAIRTRFCDYLIGTGLPCPTTFGGNFAINPVDGGGPGDTVTITATFTRPWFTVLFNQFAAGGINLSVSTTWVNYKFVVAS